MVHIVSLWRFWSILKDVTCTVACVSSYPSICLGRSTWKLGQVGSFWVRNWAWDLPNSKLRITRPRFTIYNLINVWLIRWLSRFLLRRYVFWNILCTSLHDDCLRWKNFFPECHPFPRSLVFLSAGKQTRERQISEGRNKRGKTYGCGIENILRKYSYFFPAFIFGSLVHRECNAGYNKCEIPHSFQASLLVSRVTSIFSFNLREFLSLPVIRGILPVLQMSPPLRQMTASKIWRFVTLPKECSTITSMKKQWRMCILSRNCFRRQGSFRYCGEDFIIWNNFVLHKNAC